MDTAIHVSGGTITHHQERKQLYLQHLVFVTPLLLSAAIVDSWNRFECAVGGVRHPQHTQTSVRFHKNPHAFRTSWKQPGGLPKGVMLGNFNYVLLGLSRRIKMDRNRIGQ